jgi:hypothetical protein
LQQQQLTGAITPQSVVRTGALSSFCVQVRWPEAGGNCCSHYRFTSQWQQEKPQREWQRQHRENVKGKSYHTHMLHNVLQGGGIGIHAGEPEAAAEQKEMPMRERDAVLGVSC